MANFDETGLGDIHAVLEDIKELLRDVKELLRDRKTPLEVASLDVAARAIEPAKIISRRIRTVSEAASLLEHKSFQEHQPITAEDVRAFAKGGK